METSEYAIAYMTAEAAMNRGETGPLRELLAENFTSMGLSADQWVSVWSAGWRTYRSHGLAAFGPFLLNYGSGERADGTLGVAAGVLHFNADGKIQSHTAMAADG